MESLTREEVQKVQKLKSLQVEKAGSIAISVLCFCLAIVSIVGAIVNKSFLIGMLAALFISIGVFTVMHGVACHNMQNRGSYRY